MSTIAATMDQAQTHLHCRGEDAFVARLVAGEELAFRELYRRHVGQVFHLARRFVYSDAEAEEVVQEVFVAAFKSIHRFRGQSRLRTWIYRITVNRALKQRRWWTRRREVTSDALGVRAAAGVAPDRLAADREALRCVQDLIEGLDERKRTVLLLHELEGLDTREIALILGCPRSTVLTRLARARKELIRAAEARGVRLGPPDEETER